MLRNEPSFVKVGRRDRFEAAAKRRHPVSDLLFARSSFLLDGEYHSCLSAFPPIVHSSIRLGAAALLFALALIHGCVGIRPRTSSKLPPNQSAANAPSNQSGPSIQAPQ